MPIANRLYAEFLGTAWLVLGGCGSAVLAAAFPQLGIGFAGVALAFGLTVLTMAYAIGHVSGCHFNPAVTVGPGARRALPVARASCPTSSPRCWAAIAGAAIALRHRHAARPGFDIRRLRHQRLRRALARRLRPARGGWSCEVVMTFGFLIGHPGRDRQAARRRGFAPIAIGLVPDADPPDQHPGHQHLGEPGAQHRRRRCSSAAGRSRSSGCSGWRHWSAAPSPASPTGCSAAED